MADPRWQADSDITIRLDSIVNAILSLIGFTDNLENLGVATNALLTTIRDNADQLEGYTDGLEGLIAASNAFLTTIRDNADQLEGYLDGVEGLLTTLSAKQDYAGFETQHVTLSANTDTTITFSAAVRMVRVSNWDITNILLVKNGAISSNTDASASRIGVAAALNLPNGEVYPITTSTIHLRSASTNVVTIEGFL